MEEEWGIPEEARQREAGWLWETGKKGGVVVWAWLKNT